ELDGLADWRELKQIVNNVPLALVVCRGQRCAVVVRVAGVHVRPEFNEQFDGIGLTSESGTMQWRCAARLAVHVKARWFILQALARSLVRDRAVDQPDQSKRPCFSACAERAVARRAPK